MGDAVARPPGWDDDERVRVVPYDPAWPGRFDEERRLLEEAIGPWIVGGVHHVGSTAVPGLAAKPIIDLMVGVESLDASRPSFGRIEALGYLYAPYRPDRFHWFCKPVPTRRTHHLILVPHEHPTFGARLAFRDALRADPELAREYQDLKLRLADEYAEDREGYTQAKAPFIERVLERVGV